MKLSVVIVNYNVRYFLHTCLQSVLKAAEGLDAEIIVVDNASSDDSVDMLKSDFPSVRLLVNRENVGFSRANNQAISVSKGQYVLLLNPDTIIPEDCLSSCLTYMDEHEDSGGLGVKMIDGSGTFLPESKRGLPTPWVAFYKISGLSRVFPRSKRFGKYHLGYLNEDETNEIEVLSGAFMFLRKSLLNKIGGLDESFFMYGEDIDLSYRITQAGFKNIYFPENQIIHFKGESTKKSSVNYVLVFYRAMIIFAKKHFKQGNARAFSFLINFAIYIRAGLAIFRRAVQRILLPALDALILLGGTEAITEWYERSMHHSSAYYPGDIHIIVLPALTLIWLLSQYLAGGYLQPIRMKNVFRGMILGTGMVFIAYAMFDESMRFSRAVIALSVFWSFLSLPLLRYVLKKAGLIRLQRFTEVNTSIAGLPLTIDKVKNILSKSLERRKNLYFISPLRKSEMAMQDRAFYHSSLYQLRDCISVYGLDEVVLCLGDISCGQAISIMQEKWMKHMTIFLKPPVGDYILKSSSIHSLGELIKGEQSIQMPAWSLRRKRFLDAVLSTLMLLVFPFVFLLLRRPSRYLRNMLGIVSGNLSFVGSVSRDLDRKPFLVEVVRKEEMEIPEVRERRRREYLLSYSLIWDMEVVFGNLARMDAEPIVV